MQKHIEVKTVEHKGIKVMVEIDYDSGTISLIEKNISVLSKPGFKVKQWAFGNREVEYMQGWLDILEAMAFAVKGAKADLEADQKAKEKKQGKILIDIVMKKQ